MQAQAQEKENFLFSCACFTIFYRVNRDGASARAIETNNKMMRQAEMDVFEKFKNAWKCSFHTYSEMS